MSKLQATMGPKRDNNMLTPILLITIIVVFNLFY